MKDKRTYTKSKEHGEDMSHENEIKIEPETKIESSNLSYLIEMHKKEIWEWKQRESEHIKTKNLLDGSKRIIEELSAKIVEHIRMITELNNKNIELKKELAKLKK
jgi:hypothetical protein|tara:strand:- start:524 stop:838 length:315 start_codon:yes stop_codon:yes gene_type:complete